MNKNTFKRIAKSGSNPAVKTVHAVNDAELNPEAITKADKVTVVKPSAEAIATTLKSYAVSMARSWQSFHAACAETYLNALRAFEKAMHLSENNRTGQSINAFHKVFKPVLAAQSDMQDGTIRNLLAKCREENGLPDGISPERKKQMAKAKAKAQRAKAASKGDDDTDDGADIISITINSKTSSFALSSDGEEVDNSVDGLYAILVKLQKVYGETLLEAVNKLMDIDAAVNE